MFGGARPGSATQGAPAQPYVRQRTDRSQRLHYLASVFEMQREKGPAMSKLLTLSLLCAAFFAIGGCEREGAAERAGEALDDAVDDVRDGAEDIRDEAEEAVEEIREN